MPIRAIGFDLDETLAIPRRDRAVLLEAALTVVDGPPIDREEYLDAHRKHHSGRDVDRRGHDTREPIFESVLSTYPEDDTDPGALTAAYRSVINDAIEPLDGVSELLDRLRTRYRVGLLTNGPSVAQRSKLDTLGWTDRFDAVVVTGELDAGKPDRVAFEALLSALDAEPEETIYVGDFPTEDVVGATRAGLRAIQVCYPDGPDPHPEATATIDRDRLVRDLPEIVESL